MFFLTNLEKKLLLFETSNKATILCLIHATVQYSTVLCTYVLYYVREVHTAIIY